MEYQIERSQRKHLEAYARLLSEVFPEAKKYTVPFLRWQYFENPAGEVLGFDAFLNGVLAAHYVTIPVTYLRNEVEIKGLLSLNTATGKAHQGKGLFVKLASATYEQAKQEGYQFVIGVANQNSTHGFLKKLGFELLSPLQVHVYFGKVAARAPEQGMLRGERSEAFLRWRLSNPEGNYSYSGDSLYSATHLPFFKSLLSAGSDFSRFGVKKTGFNPLKVSIGHNLNKPSLAISLPDKFKPSPLNLIFRDLSSGGIGASSSNVYFELIDFDAY